MGFLMTILQQQKEAVQAFGPMNPLCGVDKIAATLTQITQLAGFQDATKFWNQITPQQVQEYAAMMSSNKSPDPATMLANVEAEKIKADIIINAAKQELDRQKAIAQADLDRDKLYVDSLMKAVEIQAKYGAQVDMAVIKGEVDKQREEIRQIFAAAGTMQQQQPQQPVPPMMPPNGMVM
jgi:hypothetical protein